MDLYKNLEPWHLYSCCPVFLKWVNMHWSVGSKSRKIINKGVVFLRSSFRVLLTILVSHSQLFQGFKDLSLRWCSWELSSKPVLVGEHKTRAQQQLSDKLGFNLGTRPVFRVKTIRQRHRWFCLLHSFKVNKWTHFSNIWNRSPVTVI